VLRLTLDRPFAFAAEQVATGLVLVCGWVEGGALAEWRP
jgi:hypothetical protein